YDELAAARAPVLMGGNRVDEDIGQLRLYARVQVQLRLFEHDDRSRWHEERLDEHRQHLTDADADVDQADLGPTGPGAHQYFVLTAPLADRLHAEVADQAHRLQPRGDELGQWPLGLAGRPGERPPLCGQNRVDGALALDTDVVGRLARPVIEPARILAQRTDVVDAAEHPLELQHEVDEHERALHAGHRLAGKAVEAFGRRQRRAASGPSIERQRGRPQLVRAGVDAHHSDIDRLVGPIVQGVVEASDERLPAIV